MFVVQAVMLNNYFKTGFRNLLRNRTHFFVNITGLVVGFSAFLLIFLVLAYEKSFDTFHANKEHIYRVVRVNNQGGYSATASFPLAAALRAELPQVERSAAIYGDRDVQVIVTGAAGETVKKFKEPIGVFFAEPQFFSMFDFSIIAGNPANVLSETNTAVLTKAIATKYFGSWQQAMGKVLKVYNQPIRVTGIINDPPSNTDFPLGVVISHTTIKALVGKNIESWVELWDDHYCFVQLRSNVTEARMNALLPAFLSKYVAPADAGYELTLQPLKEIHFDKRFDNFNHRVFSTALITALSLIGIFLLIIACVNFINLSTANAVNRSREVGVRKALGSNRQQLIAQFFGETGITCFIAIVVAVIVAVICIPFINRLLEIKMPLNLLISPAIIGFILCTWLVVTLLAGFYPALVLSGFNPISVLKNRVSAEKAKGITLRRGLVILQFVIAQVLIIATLVVVSQLNYFSNADMGFNKEAVINAGFPQDSASQAKLALVRNLLMQEPGIQAVSFSAFAPVGSASWATDLRLGTNNTGKADLIVNMKPADTGYFNIYKLQLVAGRTYFASDTAREFIVNESLAKKLGFSNPQDAIGKLIAAPASRHPWPIVGVVKDYHISSLRDPVGEVAMTTLKGSYRMTNIKIAPGKTRVAIAAIEKIWNKVFPDYAFEYNFVDDTVAAYYKQEDQLSQLFKIFAGLAIFISCLGLYGLVSFMAARRKKEIGIRKVLGASAGNIVLLLSREFTILITIAFLVAAPVAWYCMQQWLQQYTFRIDLGVGFFIITLLSSVLIAWLTVGHSALKAALANPVKSLRTE
ncbi:duplicated orphan permease [Chitinophaga rupis]|uniref:Duplicated orphan permease n=1 Tax=Chitinophaga rupis TaxID=573321 RepID=A0A1H7W2P7_9BACT|nr:ABC transporter permease [Chitinophaga rupis]SEM15780.1 duplicated orphan permease [Chitinophaga rupis]